MGGWAVVVPVRHGTLATQAATEKPGERQRQVSRTPRQWANTHWIAVCLGGTRTRASEGAVIDALTESSFHRIAVNDCIPVFLVFVPVASLLCVHAILQFAVASVH